MTQRPSAFGSLSHLDSAGTTGLLGRLGSELALVYHDTLQAPLPPRLQALIDRLDDAVQTAECGRHHDISNDD